MFEKLKGLFHKKNTDKSEESEDLVLETETAEGIEKSGEFAGEMPELGDGITELCEHLVDAAIENNITRYKQIHNATIF